MVDSVDEPPLSRHPNSWAKDKTPSNLTAPDRGTQAIKSPTLPPTTTDHKDAGNIAFSAAVGPASSDFGAERQDTEGQTVPVVDKKGDGTQPSPMRNTAPKASLGSRFIRDVKRIITSSWINWLLITVPVGITMGILVDWAHVDAISPSAVFAVNAVAIIPLASLLAYATESVASRCGDTLGALMNVSFGNAVELIIFIIALAENQVRVVQAAALGSILANLLLILGMAFVAGGLRYREQVRPRRSS